MRQFYISFSDAKVSPMATQLNWSHYTELLPIKDKDKMMYYLNITINNNLTKRELRNKIRDNEYERLPEQTKYKLILNEETSVDDLIKEPIIIKNSNNYGNISEKILQRLILEDIPSFLKELGNGFTFIENEYKIKIGDRYNYIDLLLFNYEFNCFVVVELKVTELKKEHIGQIEIYMNYVDNNLKRIDQGKTIGIIICKKNNQYIIEYCSDKRIVAKCYELV
jgi:predicted nuclease of restriction endonuclease-like (RecB) superfamily